MTSSSSSLLIVFLACSAVLCSSSPAQAQDNVRKTCERYGAGETFSIDFCMETLLSDPRSETADLKLFGLIALEYQSDAFNQTVSYIQELIEKKWDKITTSTLQSCLEMYKSSADDLAQAVVDYKQKEYEIARSRQQMATMDSALTMCDSAFGEHWGYGKPNPMTGQTKNAKDISGVALDIVIAATK